MAGRYVVLAAKIADEDAVALYGVQTDLGMTAGLLGVAAFLAVIADIGGEGEHLAAVGIVKPYGEFLEILLVGIAQLHNGFKVELVLKLGSRLDNNTTGIFLQLVAAFLDAALGGRAGPTLAEPLALACGAEVADRLLRVKSGNVKRCSQCKTVLKSLGYNFFYVHLFTLRKEESANVGKCALAAVVGNVVLGAKIAYKDAVAFKGRHSHVGETAGSIGIGAFLAEGAAACGERKDLHIGIVLTKELGELNGSLAMANAKFLNALEVELILESDGGLNDKTGGIFLDLGCALADGAAGGRTRPVLVICVALICCAHIADFVHGIHGAYIQIGYKVKAVFQCFGCEFFNIYAHDVSSLYISWKLIFLNIVIILLLLAFGNHKRVHLYKQNDIAKSYNEQI